MSITVENDRIEVPVGTTPKGAAMVITTTPQGFYQIEYRGPGVAPAITEQKFTSLTLAKKAFDAYRRVHAAAYAKEELKNRIVNGPSLKEQRKTEAMLLKNGELNAPDTDDEE